MSLALDNGAWHSGVGKLHFLGSVQLSHCPQSPPKAWHMRQNFSDRIRTKKVYETAMMQAVLASYFMFPGIVVAMPYQVQGHDFPGPLAIYTISNTLITIATVLLAVERRPRDE
jgi:hypothetical protein